MPVNPDDGNDEIVPRQPYSSRPRPVEEPQQVRLDDSTYPLLVDIAGDPLFLQNLDDIVRTIERPNIYRAMGLEPPKTWMFNGLPGTGKCVVKNTNILTPNGIFKITEIPDNITSFDIKTGSVCAAVVSQRHVFTESKTIKIHTEFGPSIEGTPEHPILILNQDSVFEWKELRNITKKDSLIIPYNINTFAPKELMSENVAYLLGLLVGDGCFRVYQKKNSSKYIKEYSDYPIIIFTSKDAELIRTHQNSILELGAKRPAKNFSKREKDCGYTTYDVQLFKKLLTLGLTPVLSYDKSTPSTVLRSDAKTQRAFLQALFDTDGCCDKRGIISFCTVSEVLVDEVQLMLLNFGVVTKKRIKKTKSAFGHAYELIILQDCKQTFIDRIGFRLTRKQKQTLGDQQTVRNTNLNILPLPTLFNKYSQAYSQLPLASRSAWISTAMGKCMKRQRISWKLFNALLDVFEEKGINTTELNHLRHRSFFITHLKTKTESRAITYDITVPATHAFISNGFISHNSFGYKAIRNELRIRGKKIADFEYHIGEVGTAYINQSSVNLNKIFEKATKESKKNDAVLLWFDEAEVIMGKRGNDRYASKEDDKLLETLMENLQNIHSYSKNQYVFFATNYKEMMDSAAIRSGRIDEIIDFPLPNEKARRAAFELKTEAYNKRAGYKVIRGLNLDELVKLSDGFNYADIESSIDYAVRTRIKELLREKVEDITNAAYINQVRVVKGVEHVRAVHYTNIKTQRRIGYSLT